MSLKVLEICSFSFFLNLSWKVLDFYGDCPGKSTVLEYPGKSWNLSGHDWPVNDNFNDNDTKTLY